jgi:hypothetical protein
VLLDSRARAAAASSAAQDCYIELPYELREIVQIAVTFVACPLIAGKAYALVRLHLNEATGDAESRGQYDLLVPQIETSNGSTVVRRAMDVPETVWIKSETASAVNMPGRVHVTWTDIDNTPIAGLAAAGDTTTTANWAIELHVLARTMQRTNERVLV